MTEPNLVAAVLAAGLAASRKCQNIDEIIKLYRETDEKLQQHENLMTEEETNDYTLGNDARNSKP